MRAILLSVAAAVGLAACSSPPVETFGREAQEEIRSLVRDLTSAYNEKDAKKVIGLFSGAAVLMPPNAPTTRGLETIQGYFEGRFAEGATDLQIEVRDVAGAGQLAYASGDFNLRIVPPAGGAERRDRGKFLWILRDHGEHWLLEYVIFSSDLPPVAPPPPTP
jgi:uncharacterized protein (TIGR02246 family)